jgi:hypothetical protein
MSEKTPLIPQYQAAAEAAPRTHRCPRARTALRVVGAITAAGLLYSSFPEGSLPEIVICTLTDSASGTTSTIRSEQVKVMPDSSLRPCSI